MGRKQLKLGEFLNQVIDKIDEGESGGSISIIPRMWAKEEICCVFLGTAVSKNRCSLAGRKMGGSNDGDWLG